MTYSKLIKIGSRIVNIGFLIFVIQNFYFGWNEKPMSEAEETVDLITRLVLYIGFIIYIIPVFKLYELFVKELDK